MKKKKELAYINYESWKQEADVRYIEYIRAEKAWKRAIHRKTVAYNIYKKIK